MSAARHDSPVLGASQPHRILVVGGSYGGLSAVQHLLKLSDGRAAKPVYPAQPDFAGRTPQRGVELTLLDERDGFFHTVGAPLAHTSKDHVVPFWKEYSALKEMTHSNLKTTKGRIEHIDPEARRARYTDVATGETVHHDYDYVVFATGLSRQWPIVPASHSKEDYVQDAQQHIDTLESSERVVVIGGGAVGIEVAAELKVNNPNVKVTLVHSRDKLLSNEPLPDEFKHRTLQVLKEEGVDVVLGQRAKVHEAEDGKSTKRVELADGTIIEAGAVISATAHCPPNTQALPRESLDQGGFVKINPNLTFPAVLPNHDHHHAIGDIVAWTGIKRAGGAMWMGQIVANNIFAKILKSEDSLAEHKQWELPEYPAVMAIAVGKQAIGYGGPGTEVTSGEEVMKAYFQDDLAWKYCLDHMQLTEIGAEQPAAEVTA